MYPKPHIIYGLIFSIILYLIFPQIGFLEASIVFISSVLIDVDHYLYYVFKKKDISLPRAYKWFDKLTKRFRKLPISERKKAKYILMFLHGIEFIIVLIILAQFYIIFYYVLIGILFHLILDLIESKKIKAPFFKVSVIYEFIRSKNNN